MPPVHLGTVHEALKRPHPDVEVRVNVHAPDRGDSAFPQSDFGGGAEQDDWRKLDRLVDQDLERVGSSSGEPVDVGHGVMSLMDSPQKSKPVLEPMETIDVEIVGDDKESDLRRHRPCRQKAMPRETRVTVRPGDERSDHKAQDVALEEVVKKQISKKPRPKQPLARVVGYAALQSDEQKRRADHGR